MQSRLIWIAWTVLWRLISCWIRRTLEKYKYHIGKVCKPRTKIGQVPTLWDMYHKWESRHYSAKKPLYCLLESTWPKYILFDLASARSRFPQVTYDRVDIRCSVFIFQSNCKNVLRSNVKILIKFWLTSRKPKDISFAHPPLSRDLLLFKTFAEYTL